MSSDKEILISCCVTSYRHLDGIYRSIDSILKQDYPQIELAIFDDGTEEFPIDEVTRYIYLNKKDNIKNVIVHTNSENIGTVKNLNNMIRSVNGAYIVEIGADDELYEANTCTKIVNFFANTGASIVTSYRIKCNNGKLGTIVPSVSNAIKFSKSDSEEQYKWVSMGAPIAGAGTYYSRKFLLEIGGFDEKYKLQEDGPMFLHATREGTKIEFLNEITFVYAQGEGVSSGERNNSILMKDVVKMYENEILPFINRFNFWGKRRVYYGYERAVCDGQLNIIKKISLLLKYPDVFVYRKKYAK